MQRFEEIRTLNQIRNSCNNHCSIYFSKHFPLPNTATVCNKFFLSLPSRVRPEQDKTIRAITTRLFLTVRFRHKSLLNFRQRPRMTKLSPKCVRNFGVTSHSTMYPNDEQSKEDAFLTDWLLSVTGLSGRLATKNFNGKSVHILQIGLGTFSTFLTPNDTRWMSILLQASTWRSSSGAALKAIGVDPLQESLSSHQYSALSRNMVRSSFLLAAVGEVTGRATLNCLPNVTRSKIQEQCQNGDWWKRKQISRALEYLENMSSIGIPLPAYKNTIKEVAKLIHLPEPWLEKRVVPMLTFADVLRLHNTSGCEVLAIDAEGADCAILRSMLHCCRNKEAFWPWVIRFETQQHADFKESTPAEEMLIKLLQTAGYLLVDAGNDAVLVHRPTLRRKPRLAKWADNYYWLQCCRCGWYLFPSSRNARNQLGKGYTQWSFETYYRWSCQWCCKQH